jgi:hypothetical protein
MRGSASLGSERSGSGMDCAADSRACTAQRSRPRRAK